MAADGSRPSHPKEAFARSVAGGPVSRGPSPEDGGARRSDEPPCGGALDLHPSSSSPSSDDQSVRSWNVSAERPAEAGASSEPDVDPENPLDWEWLAAASMLPSPGPGEEADDGCEDPPDWEWLAAASMLPSPGPGPDGEEDDWDDDEEEVAAPDVAPSGS